MSEQDKDAGRFTATSDITLTFPNLQTAKAVMKNGKAVGEPKFSGNFEFDPAIPAEKSLLDACKAKAAAVAKAGWPGRDLSELQFPFESGTKLADKAKEKGKDREFSRGKAVLTARSKYQPRLSIIQDGKVVDLEGDAITAHMKQFYSGARVLFQVNFQAYDAVNDGAKDGVTAYLDMVLSTNKGKRLTGGASAADTFKGYVGTTSQEDPTKGDLDDEIPF